MSSKSSFSSWYSADSISVNINDNNIFEQQCTVPVLLNRVCTDEIIIENAITETDEPFYNNECINQVTSSSAQRKHVNKHHKYVVKAAQQLHKQRTFQFPWTIILISTVQVNRKCFILLFLLF